MNPERKKPDFWQKVNSKIKENIPFVLMIVAEAVGPTPGKKGFKMMVTRDGQLAGSIGGGLMEYNLVEFSRIILIDLDTKIHLVLQNHNAGEDSSGMICSGSQKIILLPVFEERFHLLKQIFSKRDKGENVILRITNDHLEVLNGKNKSESFAFINANENEWTYEENINSEEKIFIIGGGHVGLALSKVMKTLNFNVIVIDNRPELDTMINNTFANEKIILDYNEINTIIPDGDNYITIMTFGHKADELVLSKLLRKKYRYLGMMGSPVKVQQIFYNLLEQGFKSEELKKVKAPIGLNISSQTPEEIAISIAAEIIKIRNS